mmetsp:Transcript_102319/g.294538  ORF Transcript_102319/g.294538 Transcript_102319/m.294538 type:complete len:200 (+) Transcript_102319:1299-1898(+)
MTAFRSSLPAPSQSQDPALLQCLVGSNPKRPVRILQCFGGSNDRGSSDRLLCFGGSNLSAPMKRCLQHHCKQRMLLATLPMQSSRNPKAATSALCPPNSSAAHYPSRHSDVPEQHSRPERPPPAGPPLRRNSTGSRWHSRGPRRPPATERRSESLCQHPAGAAGRCQQVSVEYALAHRGAPEQPHGPTQQRSPLISDRP